jgi:superfamily II DNA or RNA helicase
MYPSLGRSGVVLKKADLGRSEYERMRRDLTVRPETAGSPFGQFGQSFRVYHETRDALCVPRHYYSRDRSIPSWTGGTPSTCPLLVFSGHLKSETRQHEAAEACAKAFRERGGGILSLPTGFGKTTVGLYVACRLGLKTLVIAHKEFLIDQWIERIRSFVPTARIGRVQQDVCDTADKDIVVAMMQSVCSKDYGRAFDDFGLLIIDEVHHISAPTFCRCMYRANCPYVLGLSATPVRKDGLTRVIEWFVGPVFFRIERKEQQHVRVKVLKYACEAYSRPPPQTRNGTLNLPELVSRVCADPARNQMVLDAIERCVAKGRKTIVLSDRRQHCMDLLKALKAHGIDAALYIGGMKQDARKESEKAAAIVATYSQANEGLDIPSLNALVMATPKSDVVQAVGRILREASGHATTFAPLIIDFLDDYGVFYAQFAKRRKYYASAGFEIKGHDEATSCAFVRDDS